MSNRAMIDAKSELGQTPLHRAAGEGQKEAAVCLLDRGADVNTKDKGGFTAMGQRAISLLSNSLSSVELISIWLTFKEQHLWPWQL